MPIDDPDRYDPFPDVLDLKQVVAKLGTSRSWLQDWLRHHPCGRMMGNKRVFTPSDYAALLGSFPKDEPGPATGARSVNMRSRRCGASSAKAELDAYNELLARLRKPKRRAARKTMPVEK